MSNPEYLASNYTTQTASQYKANIDASVAASGVDCVNLGLTYSAGTLTIAGAQGTALSASNPAFVKFQSETSGLVKYISVEANQDFIDDAGASQIIGNLFGFTTSVAIATDVPFYIYAVSDDAQTTVSFAISRVPHHKVAPGTSLLGTPSSAIADTQASMFFFDSVTVTSYDGNPCVCIGSIRMRMSASDDWTVQALAVTDGIGQYNEQTFFQMPAGQMGAGASTYTKANGGTPAVFTTNTMYYMVKMNGMCYIESYHNGDAGTDGSGAVAAQIVAPFIAANVTGAGTTHILCMETAAASTQAIGLYTFSNSVASSQISIQGGSTSVLWSAFTNGARSIWAAGSYPISLSI